MFLIWRRNATAKAAKKNTCTSPNVKRLQYIVMITKEESRAEVVVLGSGHIEYIVKVLNYAPFEKRGDFVLHCWAVCRQSCVGSKSFVLESCQTWYSGCP